jgi:pimeloyl-ACP methyl ester carboxylesterase
MSVTDLKTTRIAEVENCITDESESSDGAEISGSKGTSLGIREPGGRSCRYCTMLIAGVLMVAGALTDAAAEMPPGFESRTAKVSSASIHYVRGGSGPAVVLVHGFPEDWYEYREIMPRLAKRFTVLAIDLRGVGGSSASAGGYDAAVMAQDVQELVTALKIQNPYIVGHDVGGQVTYAFVRRYPDSLRGAMILDAPLAGIDGWKDAMSSPAAWHAHFMQVPNLPEALVPGHQKEYLAYFFKFGKVSTAAVDHYVKASGPAQLHAMFEMYRAFPANEKFGESQTAPNATPLIYGAGEKSPFAQLVPKFVAGLRAKGMTHVTTATVPGAVHYVVDDAPEEVAKLIETHAQLP